MSKLTTAKRNALPSKDFAGPGRSYPIENAAHAANAKSRAAQFASPALKAKVDAKANKVLGERSAADKKQDAALSKRTGMTGKKLENSAADKSADAKREGKVDHLAMAAKHNAIADKHRARAQSHMADAKMDKINSGEKPTNWGEILMGGH